MKLNNTVEQLKKRLENLQSQQIYTTRKNNRVSTPERDRTESNNTKSRVIGNISIKPNKEEQQRALSVLKPRKIPGDLISNKIDLIKKNQKKKHKPAGNKMLSIKQKQEKIKLELNNIKHKLNLIQNVSNIFVTKSYLEEKPVTERKNKVLIHKNKNVYVKPRNKASHDWTLLNRGNITNLILELNNRDNIVDNYSCGLNEASDNTQNYYISELNIFKEN